MKDSMQTVIPQFSTRRMVKEYVERFYVPALQ
jgi:glucan phosphorylase